MRLSVKGSAGWLAKSADEVARVLRAAAGRPVVSRDGGGAALTLADMDALPSGLKAAAKREGYVLSVTGKGVVLAANDAAGAYYGAGTLAQLASARGWASIPGATVRDWPKHPIRGAHMYLPPREQVPFFLRFLDYIASLKFNVLILEFGAGMEYEKRPEINRVWRRFCKEAYAYDIAKDRRKATMTSSPHKGHPAGPVSLQCSRYFPKDSIHPEVAGGDCLTKDEVRRLVAACAERHIEVVPEVQSLSHSYYLCVAHPEIAERADDPWPDTYCPSNPRTYELLFDVMEEVIGVTRPRLMHIGHDEAYSFRVCPKCRRRPAHKLLADDVNKIHDFLAARGVRTMMWGDKLMNITTPEGRRYGGVLHRRTDPVSKKTWVQPATWKAVDLVPKDILIADWYWSLEPKSERYFGKHGFEVMYGNYSPLGFKDWEKRASAPNVLGAEVSSWCEASAYALGHNGTLHAFYPGADTLWRGETMDRDTVCAQMARRMPGIVDTLTERPRWLVSGGKGKASPVDISKAARALPKSLARTWEGASLWPEGQSEHHTLAGTWEGASLCPEGQSEQHTLPFGSRCGTPNSAIVVDRSNPATAAIPVGRKARKLALLAGTTMEDVYYRPTFYSYHRPPATLLECRVAYADGRRARFPLIYGEDLGPIAGRWPVSRGGHCFRAVPVELGEKATLYASEWDNPRPGVGIASLSFALGPDAVDKGEVVVAAIAAIG